MINVSSKAAMHNIIMDHPSTHAGAYCIVTACIYGYNHNSCEVN